MEERLSPILQGELARGQIAHAYLIKGCNAQNQAYELAMALNCTSPDRGLACLACESCRKISRGLWGDVEDLYPQKDSLKIEQIRTMINHAGFKKLAGKYKIFI